MAHLLTVTDLELLASQVVKVLAFVVLAVLVVINVIKSIKSRSAGYKLGRLGISIVLGCISFFVLQWILIDGSLLHSDQYVIGTTMGMCQVFVRGPGIEFEYEIGGTVYRNCNTFHPLPVGDIRVMDGEYYVRYSAKYPDCGRIDFNKPVQ